MKRAEAYKLAAVVALNAMLSQVAWAATIMATPESDLTQLAMKLKPGDTLHLRSGVYRQLLNVIALQGNAEEPIVIEGEPDGTSIIRASDILANWKPKGNGLYAHSLAQETSQVFVNGSVLKQIGGTVFDGYPLNKKSDYLAFHAGEGGVWLGRHAEVPLEALPNNSFWYDSARKTLYVKTDQDLTKATVEASVRVRGIWGEHLRYVHFRDLKVQHANTSVLSRGGGMVVHGQYLKVSRIAAEWNDLGGLSASGSDITVSDVVVSYNGQLGMAGRGSRHLIQRVTATHNNRRHFNKWWEAGGFKFIGDGGLRDSVMQDCVALKNNGDGIWFDWGNQNVDLRRNLTAYNSGFGIHFEISGPGQIQHNVAIGNGQRGIYLSTAGQVTVNNNLVIGNGLQGIASITEERRDEQGKPFRSEGNRFFKNVMAWNTGGALIIPNAADQISNQNVFLGLGDELVYSKEFPSAARRPSKGLAEWNESSSQDGKSWEWRVERPSAWANYLAVKSTEMAPLILLMREVRKAPPSEDAVLGTDHRLMKVRTPIPDVGPAWIQ